MNNKPQIRQLFLLPAYHEIFAGESKYIYGTTADSVAAQLGAMAQVMGSAAPPVTFDDAFLSQYEFGLPALERNHLKGVFFAVVERTGSIPEYMGWSELRELVQLGHQVQSHSFSHVALTRCKEADLQRELELSKCILEDKLGVTIDAISIPFGRWDRRVLEACRQAGYKRVYTSDPRPIFFRNGMELIGRFMVNNTMTTKRFRELLLARGTPLMMMRAKQAAKAGIRRLIGDRNYHLLWCYLSRRESNPDGEYL